MTTSAMFRTVLIWASCLAAGSAAAAVSCTVSATPVAFGTYDPLSGTPDDSTGTVTITCTLTTPDDITFPYVVAMNQGASATYTSRAMKNGAVSLNYNIFLNSGRTQIWGDGSSGTSTATGTMTLGHGIGKKGSDSDVFTTFGRVPAGQDVDAGTYSDTLTVTVTY